jgi:hypothetical protein
MSKRLRAGHSLLISLVVAASVQGQPAKGHLYATEEEVNICNGVSSDRVNQDCDSLAFEFDTVKSATTLKLKADGTPDMSTGLVPSLQNPPEILGAFIIGVRRKAFEDLLTNKLTGEAKTLAQSSLNQLAQVLSTKAAVNQPGADPGASGSTSLVSKPTTTDLISLAAESGAFTDTMNGNSLTAKTNVDGLRRYLSNRPFSDLSPETIDSLEHITLAATFTVAQGGSTGVTPTGSATTTTPSIASIILPSNNISFDSLSVNYTILRKYAPNSTTFNKAWKKAESDNAKELANANAAIYKAKLKLDPALTKIETGTEIPAAQAQWVIKAQQDEAQRNFQQFVADYKTYTDAFSAALEKADPDVDSELLQINLDIQALSQINTAMLDKARGTICTLNYSYATPPSKPATHAATLAAAYVFKNGAQLTANAAGTWFATVPAGAKYGSVQSYQFSSEFDKPLGGTSTAPKATFSLAGYGQYQYSPTVLNITSGNLAPGTNITLSGNAQVLLGTAGWLGVAQTKLAFNVGKGMTIPVAVKWSNKTDLVTANDWKGQFGLSYDLSALSSMLSGSK